MDNPHGEPCSHKWTCCQIQQWRTPGGEPCLDERRNNNPQQPRFLRVPQILQKPSRSIVNHPPHPNCGSATLSRTGDGERNSRPRSGGGCNQELSKLAGRSENWSSIGASGGNRTRTPFGKRILSPLRLPVSPRSRDTDYPAQSRNSPLISCVWCNTGKAIALARSAPRRSTPSI